MKTDIQQREYFGKQEQVGACFSHARGADTNRAGAGLKESHITILESYF